MQRFDLSVPTVRRIYGNHVDFDVGLGYHKFIQEFGPGLSEPEDVRTVDFQRFVRAEFCIKEFGYGTSFQSR